MYCTNIYREHKNHIIFISIVCFVLPTLYNTINIKDFDFDLNNSNSNNISKNNFLKMSPTIVLYNCNDPNWERVDPISGNLQRSRILSSWILFSLTSRDVNPKNIEDNTPNRLLVPAFSAFHHPDRSVKTKKTSF